MQNQFGGRQPVGIIYNTSMSRPDAALALAVLNGFEGKREAKAAAVCVVGAGLRTAVFCDLVSRFYFSGNRNGNQALPVGLAAVTPLPPDPVMVKLAVERTNEKGEPQYTRSIQKFTDTSLAEAVIRNGVIFNAEAAIVLSAPATYLARSLDLLGARELYKQRVKRLIVVNTGAAQQDVPALRKVLAEWPGPVILCDSEIGQTLRFPGESIDKDFGWSPAHPVADAYRTYKPMPYDEPAFDLTAIHYAARPDAGFFQLSEPGTVTVGDDGVLKFAAGGPGKVRKLIVDPAQKEKIVGQYIEYASARPVPPLRLRPGPPNVNVQQQNTTAGRGTPAPPAKKSGQ